MQKQTMKIIDHIHCSLIHMIELLACFYSKKFVESMRFRSFKTKAYVLEVQKQIAEKFYETDVVQAIFELNDHSQYTRWHADAFWSLTVVITQASVGVDIAIRTASDREMRIGDIILDERDESDENDVLKEPEVRQQSFDAQDETTDRLIPLGCNVCANIVCMGLIFDLHANASAWLNFPKSKSIHKDNFEYSIEEHQLKCIEHNWPNHSRRSYFLHCRYCSIVAFLDIWQSDDGHDYKFTTDVCRNVYEQMYYEGGDVYRHLRRTLCQTSKTELNIIERSIYSDVMADEPDEIEEETSCLSSKTQARIGNVISFFITSIFIAYPIVWKFAFSFIVPHFNNIICLSSFWGAYALVGAFALLVSITRIFKNFPLHTKAAKYVRENSKNENGLVKFKCFLVRTFSTRDVMNEHEHVEKSL